MARLIRCCPSGFPLHIIQRGNNRTCCFADEQDFACYASWLRDYARRFQVRVHAWVFMTNHVHLLATPATDNGISHLMQALGRRYVRYFNRRHDRTGTLWEGRFRSSLVQTSNYLLACYRYIEMNPVRAQMVDKPSQYRWSSYRCNALGIDATLCSPHEEYLNLGRYKAERIRVYRELFRTRVRSDLVNDIRTAVNRGLALGDPEFKLEIERAVGRRVTPAAMGRPRTSDV